jgi:hypothetical protein
MANIIDFIKGEGAAIGFIKSALEAGKKATETLDALREAGLGIRAQTFYAAYNYLAGPVAEGKKYISNVTLNALPSIDRLPKSITTTLRNFTYSTLVRGFDANTGEIVEKNVNISTNTLLTKQQAIDAAVSLVEDNSGRYGLEGASASVTDVVQNSAGLVTA